MQHPATRALFEYWNKLRANRPAPERAEIDPAAIRSVLGDTFILAADFADALRFRLAGTRICTLFCREIKGEAFAALWSERSRAAVEDMIAAVLHESEAAVGELTGRTADAAEIALELLVLPLAPLGDARIRALGALVPLAPPYWLGEKPVAEIELTALAPAGEALGRRPVPLFPLSGGKRTRRGLVIYRGGRQTPMEPPG
ncbi:MAG TPA: PAS domain-containing protein [Pseudolabrys sp.]|nr:PAS domain-containing protein [Pseudolabrys sp.]